MKEVKNKKDYAVWDNTNSDHSDFSIFNSIEEAIDDQASEAGEAVEIFEVTYKSIGKYKRKTSVVKAK